MTRRRILLALVTASLAACSGASPTELHDPNGQTGSPSASDTTPPDPAPSTGDEGQPAAGATNGPSIPSADMPVEVRNVSLKTAKSTGYAPYAIDVSFEVVNRAPSRIERLHEVSLTFGGQKQTFVVSCDGVWFGTVNVANVLTLHIEDSRESAYLFPTCGSGVSGASTLPWGSTVTIELRGFFMDGTSWTASATGSR